MIAPIGVVGAAPGPSPRRYPAPVPEQMLPFLAVVAVLTLTPGPDMALVLRNGARGGTTAAWWTGLGCCTGIAGYALASAVGLAALLAASAAAFTVVKVVGALYLVHLGIMSLWHSRTPSGAAAADPGTTAHGDPGAVDPTGQGGPADRGGAFRQGLVSNLLNPKIALIFLTLIPQFVSPDEPALRTTTALAVTFLAVAVVWWRVFSWAVGALGALLQRDRVRTGVERLTGVVLIGLGVRVALEVR